MTSNLKPYPVMKDSGVPWLGKVPEHWEVRKLRQILKRVTERNRPDLPLLSVAREKGIILRDTTNKDENHNFIPDDLSNYKVVRAGQLAMNKMKAWQGSYGVSRYDGIVSPAYFVFDVMDVDVAYFHTAIRSRAYVPFFTQASDGVRIGQWDLADARMKEIPFCVPVDHEQVAIVRFLNHYNRKIRHYIRAKDKLIKHLEEQKQIIVHHAIKQGQNSEWHSLPACAILRPVKRVGFPNKMLLSLFRDFGVIPKDSRENKNVDVRDLALCQLVQPGDVVMNKMKAWQGSIAVSPIEGIVSPDYLVLQFVSDRIVPKFYHYLLRSPEMVAEYRKHAYGVRPGQWRLMYPDFRRLRLFVPPIKEQKAIAQLIDDAAANIDQTLMAIRRELELLREFRTRLIADVVTGKLDVREGAAQLPDEVEASFDESGDPAEGDEAFEGNGEDNLAEEVGG